MSKEKRVLSAGASGIFLSYFVLYYLTEYLVLEYTCGAFASVAIKIFYVLTFVNLILLVPFVRRSRPPKTLLPMILVAVLVVGILIAAFVNAVMFFTLTGFVWLDVDG